MKPSVRGTSDLKKLMSAVETLMLVRPSAKKNLLVQSITYRLFARMQTWRRHKLVSSGNKNTADLMARVFRLTNLTPLQKRRYKAQAVLTKFLVLFFLLLLPKAHADIHGDIEVVGIVRSFDDLKVRLDSGDAEVQIPRAFVKLPLKVGEEVSIPITREQAPKLEYFKRGK
jgi:hypothetical protein